MGGARSRNVIGHLTQRARLVVDARMIGDGGIGTYLTEVLPRLASHRPHWHFTLLGAREKLAALARDNVTISQVTSPIYSVREQVALPLRVPRGTSLFWSPHYNVPLFSGTPLVVTVHDVAHLAMPESGTRSMRHLYAQAMFRAVRDRARAILFDTRFSLDEFTRLVGSPRRPTAVAHLGVSQAWARAKDEHPRPPMRGPYLVYVGNFKRHKNVPGLLRAFGRAREGGRIPHRLVLVGRSEGLNADPAIGPVLRELGDAVTTTGEVAPAELMRWVAHADALVTASRYEGFGLPPLEAMAAGVPCLVSRVGSLPEVCGEAALYCNPTDEDDVAARIVEIATDGALRQRLVECGRVHAAGLTWDKCVDLTASVLEQALSP